MLKKRQSLDLNAIPENIGIIMDGNARWSKKKQFSKEMGHKAGIERLEEIIKYSIELNVKTLTIYAFSIENWSRPKSEVEHLLSLILEFEKNYFKEMVKQQVKVKVIGDRGPKIPPKILASIQRMEVATANFNKLILYIAFNYSGQDEIIRAVQKVQKLDKPITIASISQNLDTSYDKLDLLIRTSGEMRLSNFLLWQNAYSEFVFVKKMWPDFTKRQYQKALLLYQKRNRRFGARDEK